VASVAVGVVGDSGGGGGGDGGNVGRNIHCGIRCESGDGAEIALAVMLVVSPAVGADA
jgi:hypothetical protein